MRVLMVEDELRLAENVARSLRESAGYAVDIAADGQEGLFLAESNAYDVVLLDLMLPKLDGMELLSRIRKAGQQTPVLVLTARDDKESVVALLNAGADDYLTKPFDLGELLARTKALIRRGKGQPSPVVTIGDLELNTVNRTVQRGGRAITLTAMEYRVLEYLVHRPRAVVSKTELLEHLYDYNWEKFSNVIEVYISGLRRKLNDGSSRQLIRTLRGQGYMLQDDSRMDSQQAEMRRDSIQRRLDRLGIALPGDPHRRPDGDRRGCHSTRRLLSTLDAAMQAHATSVAVLVRYTEDASGHVYFDNSLLPESIDPNHPDQFMVWADRTGYLTRSEDWPEGLQFQPGPSQHWNFTWAGVPYHALRHDPCSGS